MLLLHRFQIHAFRYQFRHPDLLINPGHEHSFINRLIFSAEKILVQIDIHIPNPFHTGQGLAGKQIIHIKGMLRQLYAHFPQKLCPKDQRMHHQILGRPEMPDLIPSEQPALRKYVLIAH